MRFFLRRFLSRCVIACGLIGDFLFFASAGVLLGRNLVSHPSLLLFNLFTAEAVNWPAPRIVERKPVNCFFAMELCLPVWCWVGSFGILQHWLAIELGLRKWRVAQHILRLWPQWTARWAARCHRSWVGCRVRSCSSIDRRTRRTNVSSPCSSGRCSPQEICNASSVGTPPWDVTARTARRMK